MNLCKHLNIEHIEEEVSYTAEGEQLIYTSHYNPTAPPVDGQTEHTQ